LCGYPKTTDNKSYIPTIDYNLMKKQTRVSIADDHPITRLGVKAMLEKAPEFVLAGVADSADATLPMLQASPTDILLLDLNMPGLPYTELIEKLQFRYKQNLKIVAYTAYNEPELIKTVCAMQVAGYLLKTTPPDEFLEALRQIRAGETYLSKSIRFSCSLSTTSDEQVQDSFQKQLGLSPRELEVLVFISRGFTSQSIADQLFISKYTVETHRKNMLRKLGFSTSTELVKFAVQQGLV